ncbi:hypothetical protein [Calderihabitans maritimus]|uniref:hypothetical protein n=1 Tax=Calderihabitans maritimus TaxID=1246530 RepID=UPI0011788FE9|nr:hypothetical protein [Calderihabitans maritimus]
MKAIVSITFFPRRRPRLLSLGRKARCCTSCGFVGHADIVAATNIRQVYFEALADGPPSVGPEAGSTCKPLALAMG